MITHHLHPVEWQPTSYQAVNKTISQVSRQVTKPSMTRYIELADKLSRQSTSPQAVKRTSQKFFVFSCRLDGLIA
jgi:hypothetical protein